MNIKIKTTQFYKGNRKLNKLTGLALLLAGIIVLALLEFSFWHIASSISKWMS
jgi:multidrug transporter EmrE-like cation transporter